MFRELCGEGALKNVILVTNMWEKVPADVGDAHEKQLAADPFKPALDNGAQLARHNNTAKSAHDIIRRIMKNRPAALQIQRELVDEHKDITDTAAGKAIKKDLTERIQSCQAEVDALWEDEEVEVDDLELRMFQCWAHRMTMKSEGMVSDYGKEKRRVDEMLRLRETQQACQELGIHGLLEQMNKLRMDLEDMASNHRKEMRQERQRAEAACRELQDSFDASAAERETMKLQISRLQRQLDQSQGRNGICIVCQDEEANTAVVDCG